MKKFLSYALVAMMIVATVAVSVSAVSWVKGDGYNVYSGANYSDSEIVAKSDVTMTDNGDGSVTVKQGGYYKAYTGDNNYGGVATAEKVGLDGLEVVVDFAEAPTPTNDCWFGILLLEEPRVFNTADMASNGGWLPLIRFNVPNLEYHGDMFSNDGGQSDVNGNMFGIQSGDTIKMSVKYAYGQYIITYDHNGQVFEVPADKSLSASNRLLEDGGMAHVVVTGTLLGDLCDWEYTVSVKEGEGISAEELANREFELSKGSVGAEISGFASDIDGYYNEVVALAAENNRSEDEEILAELAAIDQAKLDVEAAALAVEEAPDAAAVEAAKTAAIDARTAAKNALDNANLYIEINGAAEEEKKEEPKTDASETPAPEADAAEETEEKAEGKDNKTLIIIIIVVVVVAVVAVVAVVLGKKKKQ